MSTIASWLDQLGLSQYVSAFAEHAVDLDVLSDLTEADLERLGVSLGHRKRMLRAIANLSQAPPATPQLTQPISTSTPSERRQITVLFCDLVGSTALAAKLDPEDLSGVMSRFQQACAAVVTQVGGYVAKYMGDGLLAYFGYPTAHEDDAERAVRAGLDLVARVNQLFLPSGEALQVRVGIATGMVVVGGTIGTGAAQEHSVVGEAPNLAARLQSFAEPNTVLISASTRRLLGGFFACENLGTREAKGIAEPIPVWRVTGERAVVSRFEATRSQKLTPFVGRESEFAHLMELWERAKRGQGQVAILTGEPGIGKSRILKALHDHIKTEWSIAIRYQCSPYHTNSAFYPVIRQMEHAARFERDDTAAIKLEKLEALVAHRGQGSLAHVELYASMLSIPTGGRYPELDLTPQQQKDLTIKVGIGQLLNLARRRPIVVMLEDAHWIDPSTHELFTRGIETVTAEPILLVITCRPEFYPPWLDHSHVTMLRLNRLPREQAANMIVDVAGGKSLPVEILEQILSKTDGVPLFVEELTKTVLESDLLKDEGDHYALAGAAPSFAIPATLHDSLMARFDRLASIKEVAQIGAAIGREFPYRLLAAVAPMHDGQLRGALAQLVGAELIFARGEPPDCIYTFKHSLAQDAVYESLLRSSRQQLHGRIAKAIEQEFSDLAETQPELIARHLEQAGQIDAAIEYLHKAGIREMKHLAYAEAIGHLEHALELLQSLPDGLGRARKLLALQLALGQSMIAGRGYAMPETREAFLRAKALVDETTNPDDKLAILHNLWGCHYVDGAAVSQQEAALEFVAEAERQADKAALCVAYRALGISQLNAGNFAGAGEHLERACALYDPVQHARLRFQYGQDIGVAALCYLSWVQWHLGFADRAAATAAEAMQRAKALDHPSTEVYATWHARGILDVLTRRFSDMQAYAERVVSLCTVHGFAFWVAGGRVLEGWATVSAGRAEQGAELIRTGLIAWRSTGARLWVPIVSGIEAEAHHAAGHRIAALRAIEEGLLIADETGEQWAVPELLRLKASILASTGEAATDETEGLLTRSLELARSHGSRAWELRAACDLAQVWRRQGRKQDALALLEPCYASFTEGFETADLRDAAALLDSLKTDRRPS